MKLSQSKKPNLRTGVTIVEVLTSIVVAVIGVTGVLVLIPFGIRQAEFGLDLANSTALANDAVSQFQIERYGQVGLYEGSEVLPWIGLAPNVSDPTITQGSPVKLDFDPTNPVGYYLIDPLWLSALTDLTAGDYPDQDVINNMFFYVGTYPPGPNPERIFETGDPAGAFPPFQPQHVHLLDWANPFDAGFTPPTAIPISLALAARMFVSRNELQFALDQDPNTGLDLDDVGPPQPYIDIAIDSTGTPIPLRRQFRGETTWNAIAIPKRKTGNLNVIGGVGGRTEGFDFYVLVYKDRSFEDPGNFTNPDSDPRFLYTTLTDANPDTIFGTGTIVLDVQPGAIDIQNDQWIMLVNYDLNGQVQVGFFRVIGSDPNRNALTIDGSDFVIRDFVDGNPNDPNRTATYAVYLRDVVSVFKRRLSLETESNLN